MNTTHMTKILEFCLSPPITSTKQMSPFYSVLLSTDYISCDEETEDEKEDSNDTDDSEVCDDNLENVTCTEFMEIVDNYSDKEFKENFRVKRSTAIFLCEKYKTYLLSIRAQTSAKTKISGKESVYMYLWYVGNTQSYAQCAAFFQIAKSTAWKIVRSVTNFLLSLSRGYVRWPLGTKATEMQLLFEKRAGISGVIGAIDSTRIPMRTPRINKERFFDLNEEFSLVLQTVVDANMMFVDICCGEPGGMPDALVLRKSQIYEEAMRNTDGLFPNNGCLLGDAAYPFLKWLIPPYTEDDTMTEEHLKFNSLHYKTRNVAASALGLLKGRFRRLFHATEHVELLGIFNLICSVCVLHNICLTLNDLPENEDWQLVDDYPSECCREENIPDELRMRRDRLLDELNAKNLLI